MAKEEKPEEKKAEVKLKKTSQKWNLYEKAGEGLKRKSKFCPKCGPGVFLAQHNNRVTCGACGYTEFESKAEEKPEKKEEKKEKKADKPEEKKPEAKDEKPKKDKAEKEEKAEPKEAPAEEKPKKETK